jgi:hypothetical protein
MVLLRHKDLHKYINIGTRFELIKILTQYFSFLILLNMLAHCICKMLGLSLSQKTGYLDSHSLCLFSVPSSKCLDNISASPQLLPCNSFPESFGSGFNVCKYVHGHVYVHVYVHVHPFLICIHTISI